jgi:hypothetical protein
VLAEAPRRGSTIHFGDTRQVVDFTRRQVGTSFCEQKEAKKL